MKKRPVKSKIYLKISMLVLAFFIGLSQKGISQNATSTQDEKVATNSDKLPRAKNVLRATPIKTFISQRTSIAYERAVYKNIYATVELQAWFQDRSPRKILFNNPNDRSVNKGLRYALGARYYSTKEFSNNSFYIGAILFYGSHKIREKQAASSGFLSINTDGRNGEVNLVSQGAKLSLGFRRTFAKTLFFEIGLDLGKAWTNKGKDTLTLYPVNKSEDVYELDLHRLISGPFVEPMLAVGFVF